MDGCCSLTHGIANTRSVLFFGLANKKRALAPDKKMLRASGRANSTGVVLNFRVCARWAHKNDGSRHYQAGGQTISFIIQAGARQRGLQALAIFCGRSLCVWLSS